jgi:hypothetical protein
MILGLAVFVSILRFPLFPANKSGMYSAAAIVTSPFSYTFGVPGTLYETSSMDISTSPYWWVNSGAKLQLGGGIGETVQGALPITDKWRVLYVAANPIDTDLGAHPQNIFRLVSRSSWDSVREEMSFYIAGDNLSTSPNRNASNGLLLMLRYTSGGQTLYYAGIRVDGTAVIKKKYNGSYYTMAQKKIFSGAYSVSSATGTSQNLLPHGHWIRLRADTKTNSDSSVSVTLSMMNPADSGAWQQLLFVTDSGSYGGTAPITGARYVGIRTDFMDVKFDNFLAQSL